jgi:hypothetical protein
MWKTIWQARKAATKKEPTAGVDTVPGAGKKTTDKMNKQPHGAQGEAGTRADTGGEAQKHIYQQVEATRNDLGRGVEDRHAPGKAGENVQMRIDQARSDLLGAPRSR